MCKSKLCTDVAIKALNQIKSDDPDVNTVEFQDGEFMLN